MVNGAVIATPQGVLPYAVIIRSRRTVVRREPAHNMAEADRLLERLLADARADLTLAQPRAAAG